MNDIASMRKTRPLPVSRGVLPEAGEAADFSVFTPGTTSATTLAFSRSARFCREMRVLGIASRIAGRFAADERGGTQIGKAVTAEHWHGSDCSPPRGGRAPLTMTRVKGPRRN